MKRLVALAMLSLVAVGPSLAAAQPTPQPEKATAPALTDLELRLRARLEALRPGDPRQYYLLGEEVVDEAQTPRDQRLAITLFVLAGMLADARGDSDTAAAACIALADATRADRDRRWLVGLARRLDPRRVPPLWSPGAAPGPTGTTAYQIAVLMGCIRSGEGPAARALLSRSDVAEELARYDRLLSRLGLIGGVSGIRREAERWPCPECGNLRILKRGRLPGDNDPRRCPNCAGNPGPLLDDKALLAHLRFESLLLQGSQRSWAAQVVTDGGAPLVDPDISSLPEVFRVDPLLVLWRDGVWVADPNAPAQVRPPEPKPSDPAPGEAQPPKPPLPSGSAPAGASGS